MRSSPQDRTGQHRSVALGQHPRPAGFPLKNEFYADVFRAESWFNFDEHWNEAHAALLFNTSVKVASRRALLLWIAHVEKREPKNLRDVELLRRAADE